MQQLDLIGVFHSAGEAARLESAGGIPEVKLDAALLSLFSREHTNSHEDIQLKRCRHYTKSHVINVFPNDVHSSGSTSNEGWLRAEVIGKGLCEVVPSWRLGKDGGVGRVNVG